MSKLGTKAIQVPKETTVSIDGGKLVLKGPKGTKELSINDKIFSASISKENALTIVPTNKNDETKRLWGTTRSILNSAVIGVSKGHEIILEMSGVGFRAILKGKILSFQLGFSHEVTYNIPEGISIIVEKQTILKIAGIDKQQVGSVAAQIKSLKPVEPYKGKGIKQRGQYVLRKEGKKK
jgi:large subunit ribosomal protein L6